LITDRVVLPLPDGAPPLDGARLQIVLYDRVTLAGVGSADVALSESAD
jgi:hypothetical protein